MSENLTPAPAPPSSEDTLLDNLYFSDEVAQQLATPTPPSIEDALSQPPAPEAVVEQLEVHHVARKEPKFSPTRYTEFGGYCYDQNKWDSEWSRTGSFKEARFRVGRIFDDTSIEHARLRRKWQLEEGISPEANTLSASETPIVAFTAAQLKKLRWIPCYNAILIVREGTIPIGALAVQSDLNNATQQSVTPDRLLSVPEVRQKDIRLFRSEDEYDLPTVWWSAYPPEADCFVAVSSYLANQMGLHIGDALRIKSLINLEEIGYLQSSLKQDNPPIISGPAAAKLTQVPGVFSTHCIRFGSKTPPLIGNLMYNSIKTAVQFPVSLVIALIEDDTTDELGISQYTLDLLEADYRHFLVDIMQADPTYQPNDVLFKLRNISRVAPDPTKYVSASIRTERQLIQADLDDDYFARLSKCSISRNVADRLKANVGDFLILTSAFNIQRTTERQKIEQIVEAAVERKFSNREVVQQEKERLKAIEKLSKGRNVQGWAELETKVKQKFDQAQPKQTETTIPTFHQDEIAF